MPRKGKKSLTVSEEVHNQIKQISEETGKTIEEITETFLNNCIKEVVVSG